MPKSRRNKVISLTKVKKKPREEKDKLIDEIRLCCEKYPRVFLISMENERTTFMQTVRAKLRPGKIIAAKNKVMQLALGTTAAQECQDNIHKISNRISGPCALLFCDKTPAEVQTVFAEYRPVDFARSGATATETVSLSKGEDALARLPHSIEAHVRALGLPTMLKEGKIHLLGDHTVCKEGAAITADQAQILKLLDFKQAKFTLTVEAHWQKGGDFEDLDVMED